MKIYLNALYQDILLQFYRIFFLLSQSIFLIIGCMTVFNNFLSENEFLSSTIFSFHLVLSCFSMSIAFFMFNKIKKRKQDVDYWHKRILTMEKNINNEREFYDFKKWQYFQRTQKDNKTELSLDILIDRKNRKIQLSNLLLFSVIFIWITLLIISFQINIIE